MTSLESAKDGIRKEYDERLKPSISKLTELPTGLVVGLVVAGSILGSAATLVARSTYFNYVKRIPNAEFVPGHTIQRKKWIKGVVTSVGDSDNFRFYHTPGLFWRWPLKLRSVPTDTKSLLTNTISVRMAAIDAPELPHFGQPGQPGGEEALAWLKNTVLKKRVWLQVLKRDQYSRIVAMPYLAPKILPRSRAKSKCISLMMLKAGWATTYLQAGAQYGLLGKELCLQTEEEARLARRGMWASDREWESPADYKKRMKVRGTGDANSLPAVEGDIEDGRSKKGHGFWSSLRQRLGW